MPSPTVSEHRRAQLEALLSVVRGRHSLHVQRLDLYLEGNLPFFVVQEDVDEEVGNELRTAVLIDRLNARLGRVTFAGLPVRSFTEAGIPEVDLSSSPEGWQFVEGGTVEEKKPPQEEFVKLMEQITTAQAESRLLDDLTDIEQCFDSSPEEALVEQSKH